MKLTPNRALIIAAFPAFFPLWASAQQDPGTTAAGIVSTVLCSYIGLPITGLGLTIGGVATTVGMVARGAVERQNPSPPPGGEKPPAAQPPPIVTQAVTHWIRENALQLRADLARGHGPMIDDLAAAVEVPLAHRPLFGHKLRARRGELLEMSDPVSLTPERATRFLRRIGEIMEGDEVLLADLDAWRARLGGNDTVPRS
jgi:hypothetical protein